MKLPFFKILLSFFSLYDLQSSANPIAAILRRGKKNKTRVSGNQTARCPHSPHLVQEHKHKSHDNDDADDDDDVQEGCEERRTDVRI